MVGAGRFELPTPGPPDRCANRAALRSDVGNQALQGAGGKNKQWFATGLPPELGYQRGILFTEKPCQHGGPQLPNCARCYRFIRAGAGTNSSRLANRSLQLHFHWSRLAASPAGVSRREGASADDREKDRASMLVRDRDGKSSVRSRQRCAQA